MYIRIFLALSMGSCLLLSALVRAQTQPASPGDQQSAGEPGLARPATPTPPPPANDQQPAQQMREIMQQIMQNMQAKGIDPMQVFQQIQSGADPADVQQQLIDQGVIDKPMLTKMKTTVQLLALNQIKQQLEVTDEEWSALLPKVQRVLTAQMELNRRAQGGGGRGMAGFFAPQDSALAAALKDLRAAAKNQATTPEAFVSKLASWRSAYQKAANELSDAQADLASVLTVRQEAALTASGMIP